MKIQLSVDSLSFDYNNVSSKTKVMTNKVSKAIVILILSIVAVIRLREGNYESMVTLTALLYIISTIPTSGK